MKLYFSEENVIKEKNEPEIISIKDRLDGYIIQLTFILGVSYLIERYSGIYFANEVIQAFKHFDQQGLTSSNIFYGRCSGAYYYTTHCKQKKMASKLDDKKIPREALKFGYGPLYISNNVASGFKINCSPGHSKNMRDMVARYNWDGPHPIQSEDDCEYSKRFEALMDIHFD